MGTRFVVQSWLLDTQPVEAEVAAQVAAAGIPHSPLTIGAQDLSLDGRIAMTSSLTTLLNSPVAVCSVSERCCSIPIAIADVTDEVINRPMLIIAPGFGAGAVAGYAVLRIDQAIVAPTHQAGQAPTNDHCDQPADQPADQPVPGVGLAHGSDDIATPFGV